MAKKVAKRSPETRDAGKTRFELRFDDDIYAEIKRVADAAGISVNQLMHGMARWAVQNGMHVGEPTRGDHGAVRGIQQDGCIWVGSWARFWDKDEEAEARATDPTYEPDTYRPGEMTSPGDIKMVLDFTERRVVREDF